MSHQPSSSSSPAPHAGAITDVAGIEVGHFSDPRRPTGCTVILAREGAVAGVDVRGAAPGTRETDLLAPGNFVQQVHAVMLAGVDHAEVGKRLGSAIRVARIRRRALALRGAARASEDLAR